jgi:hypothetical protein
METPSFRTTGKPEIRWEDDVNLELKLLKPFIGKSKRNVEMNGNGVIEGAKIHIGLEHRRRTRRRRVIIS